MSYLNKIRLAAAIGTVIAVSAPVLLKAEDPQEKPIPGSIRLPNEANQEAAQADLASITAEQAVATAKSSPDGSGGKLLRVELQNEDGFLVYNVELVSPDKKYVKSRWMPAVPARSCELMWIPRIGKPRTRSELTDPGDWTRARVLSRLQKITAAWYCLFDTGRSAADFLKNVPRGFCHLNSGCRTC